ncbi:MAG: hypothetical protein K6E13_10345 [Lachnospiraceae bacterium]|nr:hypothetical protein [Lachnospiraceae bacterium]
MLMPFNVNAKTYQKHNVSITKSITLYANDATKRSTQQDTYYYTVPGKEQEVTAL